MKLPYFAWLGWFVAASCIGLSDWLLADWFLLFAILSLMSWLLAFETHPFFHEGVLFFDAHGIYIHGIWVSFFLLPVVEGHSRGCHHSGRHCL